MIARPTPAPVRVPAVASIAIREILTGRPRPATVLGTATHAVWLRVGDGVVVVTTKDATRLPNGIEIGNDATAGTFAGVEHGIAATVGAHRIVLDALTVDAVRWWDPHPALPDISGNELAARAGVLPHGPTMTGIPVLQDALEQRSATGLVEAALGLLGRGPGLTPEGDDFLAGAVAAIRILGTSIDDRAAVAMLDCAAPDVSAAAATRTTTFSAALIDHALRGQVARPAAALFRALGGRGDVAAAHASLLRVGHSSGPALAAGIALAVRTLTHTNVKANGGTT